MTPILYSFRRCPYAMRARLALLASGIEVELREIALKNKPAAFLEKSANGTVPCLVTNEGAVDESLDIMFWSLKQSDPSNWLDMPKEGLDLIHYNDGPFKQALDRTKYPNRYDNIDIEKQRALASEFLIKLDQKIDVWIFNKPTLADFSILPFVRQFAAIDRIWFDQQEWPNLRNWLDSFLGSDHFEAVMKKYSLWQPDDEPQYFPKRS